MRKNNVFVKQKMTLIVGRGHARKTEMMVNRTQFSGGSIGGDKKPGTVYIGPSWPRSTISVNRANKDAYFNIAITTKYPVQRNNSTFSLVHGLM
jgi:hypothetical protein